MRQPPMGFDSWVAVYDHCMKNPIPNRPKTLVFTYVVAEPEGDDVREVYKVRWDTIERNCWREIQERRSEINDNWNKIT